MTQVASPVSVRGNFDNVRLTQTLPAPAAPPVGNVPIVRHEYTLEQRGDEYWTILSLIDARGTVHAGGEQQIVMTTGSHHYQIYWTSPQPDRLMMIFPFVYLFDDQRWVSRESALLSPPSSHQTPVVWNGVCIRCHSTHAQPRIDVMLGRADTHVAELGISCEACHGPGQSHVEARQRGEKSPAMIHPGKLTAERSSQVCGQCHSVATFPERDWVNGFWNKFKPGDDLHEFRNVVRLHNPESMAEVRRQHMEKNTDKVQVDKIIEQYGRDRFWSDGVVRTTGREYNSITQSKCYDGGELSCLSCHSMHDSEPNDQLARELTGDRACLQCHADSIDADQLHLHTHHQTDSAGSRCVNCHMPHTSYGLLKAIRSHRIDVPSIATTVETGRPIACNQCHLDKSLGWTQDNLAQWYPKTKQVPLTDDQKNISATVLWLHRGEAGQRALAAWTMGWDEARAASGDDWLAPHLATLLDDPYDAVRYVAARSLGRLNGFTDLDFDFLGAPSTRRDARERALTQWQRDSVGQSKRPSLLIDEQGQFDQTHMTRIRQGRDDRPVNLAE